MKKIGFIGLGVMGYGMAANLIQKQFDVTVYNRTAGKADELVKLGAKEAASAADAGRDADVIITMISNDDAIREVYYGGKGVLEAVRPGVIVIDSSTISPSLARELANSVEQRGGKFLDAPVTGSKPAADAGTLVFMVGGDSDTLGGAMDVLNAMGTKIIPMGLNGTGAVAKLAHNTIVGINIAALSEGLAIATSGGLDGQAFLELVKAGSAGSKQAELKGDKLLTGNYDVQFSLALMLKDLKLSSVLSDNMNVPTPMLEAAKSLFVIGETMGSPALICAASAKRTSSGPAASSAKARKRRKNSRRAGVQPAAAQARRQLVADELQSCSEAPPQLYNTACGRL
ncbi:NAD(P)-dependent oxidoreductase [Paenibacillus protaetiae]|uniref:NAD(P)-dependent oxidoreductase n=1 Tax=Paenibacillus protaetiae TaxID=2509456 RepID=UPI0026876DB8